MANRTFFKIGKEINKFLDMIISTTPDYIVPVKKKGCKLLKYTKKNLGEISEKIRYKDYFANNDIDLKGKRIAIIDDASKFTSMLFKYRNYFEEKGAIVDTYSYVGHEKLRSGEREKYDTKAYIHKYLEESTYQEYLNQQSKVLVSDGNFFDIDHLEVKINFTSEKYERFLNSLSDIGEIEFVNDVYTPEHIEKISIINIGFWGAEGLFDSSVSQGALQKIRMVYNRITQELFIAPLSFPSWDSNKMDKNILFTKVPFLVPYENNNYISKDGIYFNIVYVFQLSLLKFFLDSVKEHIELERLLFLTEDLVAYVGNNRAECVVKTAYDFLNSKFVFESIDNINRHKIVIPRKSATPFLSLNNMMSELRTKYNEMISNTNTLVGVRYFLAYEEIIERYIGKENIIKWIDILCDRGVLVTRNYCENGLYYRACRSGESDYDLLEKKSGAIVATAINACGLVYDDANGKKFCCISSTYLNKVLANFVFDYPKTDFDCHTLFSKPYNYGPLVYIENRIEGNTALSLYGVGKISKNCAYDNIKNQFIALSNKNEEIRRELTEIFGQADDMPYTELTAYLGFLKYVKEQNGTDNFLNALSICRDEETYFRHIYYNIHEAFKNIIAAKQNKIGTYAEKLLRQAATLINSAKTKLSYEQKDVREFIVNLSPDIVYELAQQKIIDSFVPFKESFCQEIIPVLKQISSIEFLLVNVMLFNVTCDTKFWFKMYREYLKQEDMKDDSFDILNAMMGYYCEWGNENYSTYQKLNADIIEKCIDEINNRIVSIQDNARKYINEKERRRNTLRAINNIKNHIKKHDYKNILVLYYTFSGCSNINDEREIDVVKKVQDIVTTKFEGGKLICGAEEDEYGLYITDSLENAIDFANKILRISKEISNVFFRFGCGYRALDIANLADNVKDALSDAQRAANRVNNRHAFIISKDSFTSMLPVESKEHIGLCKPLQRDSKEYYEFEAINMMNRRAKKYDVNTDDTIRIGIITVLPEEHMSMKVMLENGQDVEFPGRGSGNQFVIGEIKALNGEVHRVALARTLGDGNNKAAIRAAKLLEHFPKMEVIFMVGIAGGTPVLSCLYNDDPVNHLDKHVRLGDVVVSKGIFQYDYVKEKVESFVFKGDNIPPCSKVVEAQQRLEELLEITDEEGLPWNLYVKAALGVLKSNYIRPDCKTDKLYDYNGKQIEHPVDNDRTNIYPRIFSGKIASSNTVLKNPQKRDLLKRDHDVYAIEMETSGIADATWEAGIGYYGVRGICDYCDSYKNDIWHRYAALVAAAYTKALIEQMPT